MQVHELRRGGRLRFVGMFELVGRLQQYKRATASFLRWLAGLAPPKARRAREILLAAQRGWLRPAWQCRLQL